MSSGSHSGMENWFTDSDVVVLTRVTTHAFTDLPNKTKSYMANDGDDQRGHRMVVVIAIIE